MNKTIKKLMLSEMCCVTCLPGEAEASEEALVKAVTANENLLSLGFCLKPADIARLAASPSLNSFYADVEDLVGKVKAEPMYPGFPEQVMEMDEAQYRLHQIMHYFSTYGFEFFYGVKVSKGWLPGEEGDYIPEQEREDDDRLLKAKTLELLYEGEAASVLSKRILGRRERMTLPEREFVSLALEEIASEELEDFQIPFKENLLGIFVALTQYAPDEQAYRILRALCKHTGDVMRGAASLLAACNYHLRTTQKRFVVKLLESYPVTDFKANLILSRKKANRSLVTLQYLDYNIYSRSDGHKDAVRALRDGELKSWEGQARYLLSAHEDGALQFVAARPGMMLRMVAWLLRLGYPAQEIQEKLLAEADVLSAQTLVTVLTHFGDPLLYENKKGLPDFQRKLDEADAVFKIFTAVFAEKLKAMETPIKGKKVFVDMEEYDLVRSELQCNTKSQEGGYIRSGIAYRIPDEVQRMRFFVYWDDPDRVDIDLHASAHLLSGDVAEVGWDSDFRNGGLVMSGDITHSDAAEYIDIDLTKPLREVATNINLFSGKRSFGEVETCFVGMMAVEKLGADVRHYNPANCFFSHELRGNTRAMNYGYVDVVNRCLVFVGKENDGGYYDYRGRAVNRFSLQTYLDDLFAAQGAVAVENREEADIVLKMGKAEADNEISFIDSNYFLDL